MLRIFITKQLLTISMVVFTSYAMSFDGHQGQVLSSYQIPKMVKPLSKLFSHKAHMPHLETLNLTCQNCHNFSIKNKIKGPLSKPVQGRYLKPAKAICHQCHLGRISLPKRNQCTLCHKNKSQGLKPIDHAVDWAARHGRIAQFDSDSCTKCHRKNDCSDCHLHRMPMKKNVHRANFRFSHSIEARLNPQKCTSCHQYARFCMNCHLGKAQ
ncbi:MAG: hypothetical protein ISR65_02495 [Bacteriovoracaceae bacterium]|nr:hypothetical protein [Bacteriovoracaceae bacterium]